MEGSARVSEPSIFAQVQVAATSSTGFDRQPAKIHNVQNRRAFG